MPNMWGPDDDDDVDNDSVGWFDARDYEDDRRGDDQ